MFDLRRTIQSVLRMSNAGRSLRGAWFPRSMGGGPFRPRYLSRRRLGEGGSEATLHGWRPLRLRKARFNVFKSDDCLTTAEMIFSASDEVLFASSYERSRF